MGKQGEDGAAPAAVETKKEVSAPVTADVTKSKNAAIPPLPPLPVPGVITAASAAALSVSATGPQQATASRFSHLEQIAVSRFANVTAPKRTLMDASMQNEFGSKYKEQKISANKRAKKALDPQNVLHKKEQTARLFESVKAGETDRQIALLEAASAGLSLDLKEEDAIALTKVMNGTLAHDQALLQDYAGTSAQKEKAVTQILEDFLRLDLSAYDLSDEDAIARGADSLEALNSRLEGMALIEVKNKAFFDSLPRKLKDSYLTQKQNAMQVVSYYRITKMIATDPYYRSHFNSEISRQYDPDATPAQMRLTRLLWKQTALATHNQNGVKWRDPAGGCVVTDSEEVSANSQKYIDGFARIGGGNSEFKKAYPYTDQTDPHFAFFQGLAQSHPDLYDKIYSGTSPAIAGTDITMGEGICRTTPRALEGFKGIRSMTQQQIITMLENIYEVPAGNATAQDVAAVKSRNIAGLKEYKRLLAQHAFYLEKKYPDLYENAGFNEIMKRKEEIRDDLCSAQIMVSFTRMMQKVPELYDPENEQDREIVRIAEYISGVCWSKCFSHGAPSAATEFQMEVISGEITALVSDGNLSLLHTLDKLEQESPEVKWDAEVEALPQQKQQQPVKLSETIERLKDKKMQQEAMNDSERAKAVLKEQRFSVAANPMTTSSLMKDVKACYTELDRRLKTAIPEDEASFKKVLGEILQEYDDLIESSRTYEEKRNPRTTLGKERKKMVHDIRERAERERIFFSTRAWEHFRAHGGGSFGDVLKEMRTVFLKPTAAMVNKGAGTSELYQLDHEGKTVFYKPEKELFDRRDIVEVMRHCVPENMDEEDHKMFSAILAALEKRREQERESAKKLPAGQSPSDTNEDGRLRMDSVMFFNYYSAAFTEYIRNDKKLTQPMAEAIYNFFESQLGLREVTEAYRSAHDKTEDEHKLRVVRMLEPGFVTVNQGFTMFTLDIGTDETAAMRNVATSRAAEVLGISELIVKSDLAVLEKGGELIPGIAMDEAQGKEMGKIHQKAKDTQGRVEYTAKALLQISMLQVFDAICLQGDRKGDNFFGQYPENGGVYTVTGITGIDNDMAFGKKRLDDFTSLYSKEKLVALPGDFVQRVLDLNPAVLAHQLSDILTDDELTALDARIAQVKKVLREKIAEDPKFTDVSDEADVISRFRSAKASGRLNSSYFL